MHMAWTPRNYKDQFYTDPREELEARVQDALIIGESHIAVSTALIQAALATRTCDARTIINGNRSERMLVEIGCKKTIDPTTGSHLGMHQNGKNMW
jgi:hypothetical protein